MKHALLDEGLLGVSFRVTNKIERIGILEGAHAHDAHHEPMNVEDANSGGELY